MQFSKMPASLFFYYSLLLILALALIAAPITVKNKTIINSTRAVPHCLSSGALGSCVASTYR